MGEIDELKEREKDRCGIGQKKKRSIRNDVRDVKEGGACEWKVDMDKSTKKREW